MSMSKIILRGLILCLLLILSQDLYSQESDVISVEFRNTTLKEALIQLEENGNYNFFFQDEWFDEKTFSKSYKKANIGSIVEDLLQHSALNFLIYENSIILTKNNVIRTELPINYFNIKTPLNFETNKNSPIFQKEFVSDNNQDEKALITIGKENKNSSKRTHTISGYIRASSTEKPIGGLDVYLSNINIRTRTDPNGYYTIKVPAGLNVFRTKGPGFKDLKKNVVVFGDGTLDFRIFEAIEEIGEVIIKSNKDDNIRKAVVGITKIDIQGAKNIPLVLGEKDLLKIATTMPGVKTAGEGALGYNVRGGKSDQNLILLDNAVMYNPSHFFGIFSAINPFSTGDVSIYKGSIPAEFGGRLSSVIEISTKDVNKTELSGQGNIGPVTGNLTLEVPLTKEKTAILAGVRSTYSNWLLKQVPKESIKNSQASFLDAILRFDSDINEKNSVEATAYYSNDQFSISSDSTYKYSNRLASLNWSHEYTSKLKSTLQLNHSQYKFNILYDAESNNNFDLNFNINETQLKYKYKHALGKQHKLDYGFSSKLYTIDPGEIVPLDGESLIERSTIDREKALESAVFISDLFKVNDKLLLNLGLRYSYYISLGKGTQNVYAAGLPISEESVVETIQYQENEIIKTYGAPEIRASLRYMLTPNFSIKGSYNKTNQYLHLLSSNTTASPVDTWKLSNLNTKPQKSDQYAIGLFNTTKDDNYEISLEGYYKTMTDILDFKVGAELILNDNIETELLTGNGEAYGVEFLVKKTNGRLNGWLGYSYSRSFIKLESDFLTNQVNNGDFFPTNYDRPHDVSLITNYKLTKRFSVSSNFVYQTGRPITYPIGLYEYAGIEHVLYSNRNQFRIPDYYRFDLGINIEGNHKIKKLAHSFWNISVYNLLGRNNPHSVFFVNEEGIIKAYKTSIFAIPIPTITYNFKF